MAKYVGIAIEVEDDDDLDALLDHINDGAWNILYWEDFEKYEDLIITGEIPDDTGE